MNGDEFLEPETIFLEPETFSNLIFFSDVFSTSMCISTFGPSSSHSNSLIILFSITKTI